MKKYLNKKETLLKLIECVKNNDLKFICNYAEFLCDDGFITNNMVRWVKSKMNPNLVPKRFHNKWYLGGGSVLWHGNEEEMRVKYLEYLIEQL